jgi:hypothetical protein
VCGAHVVGTSSAWLRRCCWCVCACVCAYNDVRGLFPALRLLRRRSFRWRVSAGVYVFTRHKQHPHIIILHILHRTLNLAGNVGIGGDGLSNLVRSVSLSPSLLSLNLNGIAFTRDSGAAVAETLGKNPPLKELHVTGASCVATRLPNVSVTDALCGFTFFKQSMSLVRRVATRLSNSPCHWCVVWRTVVKQSMPLVRRAATRFVKQSMPVSERVLAPPPAQSLTPHPPPPAASTTAPTSPPTTAPPTPPVSQVSPSLSLAPHSPTHARTHARTPTRAGTASTGRGRGSRHGLQHHAGGHAPVGQDCTHRARPAD